jgi:hypothetical protein
MSTQWHFHAFDAALHEKHVDYQASIPPPYEFMQSRDGSSNFISSANVARVAKAVEEGGYLRRAARRLRKSEPRLASDLEALRHFLPLVASLGPAMHYFELPYMGRKLVRRMSPPANPPFFTVQPGAQGAHRGTT